MRRRKPTDFISASEIASAVYCLEQWRLEYGLRHEPANRAERQAGTAYHRQTANVERSAGLMIAAGRGMAVIGFLALLWLLWGSR